MSKVNDAVAPDEAAPLVFAVQGDPERLVYRDPTNGQVLLEPYYNTGHRRKPLISLHHV